MAFVKAGRFFSGHHDVGGDIRFCTDDGYIGYFDSAFGPEANAGTV